MTTRELLELASLDALGLLDEDERDQFEAAFRAASPELQAQIRREQLRFATLDPILPDVEPPIGLRARVVAAVREAISAVTNEPIAKIGPAVAARALSTARLWRAACIGFATASLVLAGFVYEVSRQNRDITSRTEANAFNDSIRRLGPAFARVYFHPNKEELGFVRVGARAGEAKATLALVREEGIAFILCKDLPTGGPIRIVALDANGEPGEVLKEIDVAAGEMVPVAIQGDFSAFDRIAIIAPVGEGGAREVILEVRLA